MVRALKIAPAPLPPGRYLIRTRETTPIAAAMNGHAAVHPHAECTSDGKWCVFYCDGQEVWSCNAVYAAANFDVEPV